MVPILLLWLCTGNIYVIHTYRHVRSCQCFLATTQPVEGRTGACCSRWALTAKGFLFQSLSNGVCSTSLSKWKSAFEWEQNQEDDSSNKVKRWVRAELLQWHCCFPSARLSRRKVQLRWTAEAGRGFAGWRLWEAEEMLIPCSPAEPQKLEAWRYSSWDQGDQELQEGGRSGLTSSSAS